MSKTIEARDGVWLPIGDGVEIRQSAWTTAARRVLTPAAIERIAELHREFESDRATLLADRLTRQAGWDRGELPGYLDGETTEAARGDWRIAPIPSDLMRRRVEITGPVNNAKMVIQMLSRGDDGARADAAMLDFEDSLKPEWTAIIDGQENLAAAAAGTLVYIRNATASQPEKIYRLDPDDMPILMVRCRGLHLEESNLRIDGAPASGGIMDLALAVFQSARTLFDRDRTPAYYIPKCEHHLEARWWARLLTRLEQLADLPFRTLRATLLIETLPAAFQIEEILWEMRDHAVGLNVGRWDKIFSDIKVLKEHPDRILADRATISLDRPWMRAYAEQLIKVCHRHGAFAMGGMAAFTPGSTPERRREQLEKVVEDKRFEHALGHDGCWISHPFFIDAALSAFKKDNQLDVVPDVADMPDLLPQGGGPRTLAGLRKNIRVGIAYMKGWNAGLGCVAWDDLMEDLATLEISRAQVWQWLHHGVALDDGPTVTRDLVAKIFDEEQARIESEIDPAGVAEARAAAEEVFTESQLRPFLGS